MGLLDNKVALITGAGRGIGKAIALRFTQEGCNIAFTDIALNDVVMETEKELQALGIKAKAYASNAANFEETHQVVDEIVKDFGRIDILVNNAGITKDTALKRMTEEQWDAVINVNLKSVFNFTKAVQPVMWKQAGGSVINMSSVVGVSAMPTNATTALRRPVSSASPRALPRRWVCATSVTTPLLLVSSSRP